MRKFTQAEILAFTQDDGDAVIHVMLWESEYDVDQLVSDRDTRLSKVLALPVRESDGWFVGGDGTVFCDNYTLELYTVGRPR